MGSDWAPAAVCISISLACAVYYTAKALFRHRERMAKIQKGIDPDAPPHRNP